MPDSSSSLGEPSPEFLFTDKDFESDDFHAATFVAKYRRATSLDSLRSQLRQYCQSLKDQLYNIINRDYKDFITIATKLEGVDNRVEYLRKPLIELRMDLTLLHDTMVSNLHAISGKIQERREVSNRRRLLESSLACMAKLSSVEAVLKIENSSADGSTPIDATVDTGGGDKNSNRLSCLSTDKCRPALSRRVLMQKVARAQAAARGGSPGSVSPPERVELQQCSELERAAMALAEARQHLLREKDNHQQPTSASGQIQRTLGLRAQKVGVALLGRLQLYCKVILSSSNSNSSSNRCTVEGDETRGVDLSACRHRSLGHLLRGLVALNSGSVAEDLVSELYTCPAVKNILTQGRVDGSRGRGSFSGLRECLGQIVSTLQPHVVDIFMPAEEIFGSHIHHSQSQPGSVPSIDLVVNGVWVPILITLKKSFAGMFSSGIANVFHECYIATHLFIQELSGICGSKWKDSLQCRLRNHKSYEEFKGMWKMDLHYMLRAREVMTRLDKSLALTTRHGLASQVFEETYTNCTENTSNESSMPVPSTSSPSPSSELKLSISVEEILHTEASSEAIVTSPSEEICDSRLIWKLSFTRVFVIEVLTCLHSKVFLRDLGSKLLSLIIKVLNCYTKHLLVLVNGSGSSAGQDLTQASPSKSTSGLLSSPPITLKELVWVLADLHKLEGWIGQSLVPLVQRTLFSEGDIERDGVQGDGALLKAGQTAKIESCFKKQIRSLQELAPLIWEKMGDIVAVECRNALKAVKSVAGKFRMTNKPPPDSASSYVSSILKPLRSFLNKYQGSNATPGEQLSVSSTWKLRVAEGVASAYHQQIESLLATAQQMDTALQRRSKMGKRTANGVSDSATQMTDSEKIGLQILLDARSFGEDIKLVCDIADAKDVASYKLLLDTVEEAQSTCGK